MMRTLVMLAAVLVAPQLAAQDDAAAAAEAARNRLDIAAALLESAETRSDRVAALTETVQAYEDGLSALREGLRRAAIRDAQITAELGSRREEIGQLLGVLHAMGRNPAPVLLLHPQGALGTARGGMIAADVAPSLQVEADALAAQLQDVAVLRQLQESAVETLQGGLQGAQEARTRLAEAISNRTELPRRFSEDPVQTALLLASSETLDAFATGLAGALPAEREFAAATAPRGALPLPVNGQLLRGFGQQDAAGIARPGVIIAARPRALVTSPVAATLLFRGPLLDFGNVVIIEPDVDTMIVIAGLAEVFGEPGEVLSAGAALGLMGGETPGTDANLTARDNATATDRSQTLYLEVREGQTPVDPANWFALE